VWLCLFLLSCRHKLCAETCALNVGTICLSCHSSRVTPGRDYGERIEKKIKDAGRRTDSSKMVVTHWHVALGVGMLQFPFVAGSLEATFSVKMENNQEELLLKVCQVASARGSTSRS